LSSAGPAGAAGGLCVTQAAEHFERKPGAKTCRPPPRRESRAVHLRAKRTAHLINSGQLVEPSSLREREGGERAGLARRRQSWRLQTSLPAIGSHRMNTILSLPAKAGRASRRRSTTTTTTTKRRRRLVGFGPSVVWLVSIAICCAHLESALAAAA